MNRIASYLDAHAWGYALLLVFFGLFTGRVNPLFFGADAEAVFPLYAHAAEVGQFVFLFATAAVARVRPVCASRLLSWAACVLLSAGLLATWARTVWCADVAVFAMLAGALFGAGQGACFLCWLVVYAAHGLEFAISKMIASTVLSALLLVPLGAASSPHVLFALLTVVVCACCVLTVRSYGSCAGLLGCPSGVDAEAPRVSLRLFDRSLLCLIAIAFVCGAQRVVSFDAATSQLAAQVLFPVGYVVGAAVFALAYRAGCARGDFRRTYPVLLAVMATCGLLQALPVAGMQTLLYAVINVAFTVASMFMVASALVAARDDALHPLVPCGFICGSVYFAIQLGRIICGFVYEWFGASGGAIMVMSVVIVYVVAMAAISSGAVGWRGRADEGSADSLSHGDGTDTLNKPIAQGTVHLAQIVPVSEEQVRANPVYRTRYGLTDRELDMAVLLLGGFNATEMAQELGLSVNTVKTHLKKLYAKMDVHNRRELIEALGTIEKDR